MGIFSQFVLILTLLIAFIHGVGLHGQDVTVINNYPYPADTISPEGYVLSNVTQHTYVVNEFAPLESGQRNQLNQMIRYGLRAYIDNQYYASNGSIFARESPEEFNKAAAAIVRNAIWIHDFPFFEDFSSFTPLILAKAGKIKALEGTLLVSKPAEKMGVRDGSLDLYAFQRMVYDLKISAEQEVALFLDQRMYKLAPEAETVLLETTTTLEQFSYILEANDENGRELSQLKPNLPIQEFGKRSRRRSGSDLYAARMVELLEKNNQVLENYGYRFGDLQTQIDEIRNDRSETNDMMREELVAMRDLIREVLGAKSDGANIAGNQSRALPVATLIFEKNGVSLSEGQKMELNAIVNQLFVNQRVKVLVNGYADRSGNPALNARLSEQRAEAVGDYLKGKGIGAERILVNYLGDQQSLSANPGDRKVELILVEN